MLCPFAFLLLTAAPYQFDPNLAEECRSRDGLPNVLAKLSAGETVRIAYFGGSITAAAGWRPKTLAWFKEQYPDATVEELNAAISGTGSDYGACRVQSDVLQKNPDLVFLECRVNGGGGFERESVEGVVRQIWTTNPRIDICFVYTISQGMLKGLQEGHPPGFGRIMETIANAYGVPTIDLGVEIAKQEQSAQLIFKADQDVPGKVVFSHDGVHPGDAGHNIYRDVIARSITSMRGVGTLGDHQLPAPLIEHPWDNCSMLPIDQVAKSDGWQPVDTETDPVYREVYGRTNAMLRGAFKCATAGPSVTVKWRGTTVGIADIPYGEPVVIEAAVDGGAPIELQRAQREGPKHARFCYLPAQPYGDHEVVFTVKSLPAGQEYYLGQVLVVGTTR